MRPTAALALHTPLIPPALRPAVATTAVLAAAAPSLLAYNLSPSPTFLNQALALALWGAFVALAPAARPGRGAWAVLAALGVMTGAVLWSWGPGGLPASLALSALGLIAAAAVMVAAGAGARNSASAEDVFALFCLGWLVAGVLNAGVAVMQVFAPALPDGDWIASSSIPGRAVGNLRQPNHLSSLLLWAGIAVVALAELRRIGPRLATVLLGLMVSTTCVDLLRRAVLTGTNLPVRALRPIFTVPPLGASGELHRCKQLRGTSRVCDAPA